MRSRSGRTCAMSSVQPIVGQTRSMHRPVGPTAYDCVKLVIVRDGSAIFCSGFGERVVTIGDAILLCANTLCAAEPDEIAPLVRVSPVRLSTSQREKLRPATPQYRRFVPLRSEAMRAANLLREDISHHWTAKELANRVHLSESQLSRVFADRPPHGLPRRPDQRRRH